jgi:DNA-binding NarL/FixJ family response regulator
MPTRGGCKRLALSTIVLRGDDVSVILHTIQEAVLLARPGGDSVPALTRRQREILALLSEGVRAREIAMRLMLSETTVRNHIQSLLLTLGVHSQLEAVARAHALSLADERATG